MRMSENSYKKMNKLAGECFNANAIIDNLAYSLEFHYFSEIAKIVHLCVAHVMPEWADLVTDKMLELSARPKREDINGYGEDYSELPAIFDVLYTTLRDLLESTRDLISIADINEDDEVRIFAESFLERISVFVKQAEEWKNAAAVLDAQSLNIHIKQYTHFIEV